MEKNIYAVSNIVHGMFKHGNDIPILNRQEDYIKKDIFSLVNVPRNKAMIVFNKNEYKPSIENGGKELYLYL